MLTREIIKNIRRIEITTNRSVNHQLAGQYQSVFKGRGMAFSEVRQYQPGDEIRSIDWNVSARMGDVYVKRYVEERELSVMLVVDMSGSQSYGTRVKAKRQVAAELAALFAFSAIANNDRVGLVAFSDVVEKVVPPKKGRKHVLRVISEVLTLETKQHGTNIGVALEYVRHLSRRRSVTFVISDFLDQGYEQALRIVARRHDVVPVILTDPTEDELPALGLISMRDPETGAVVLVDTADRDTRAAYRKLRQEIREKRERLLRQLDMDFIEVRNSEDYVGPLVRFFHRRAARART